MRKIIVLAATVAFFTACGKPPAPAGAAFPPMPAGVASPIVRNLADTQEYTGRLEPIQIVEVRARIGGTVTKVPVRDGAIVGVGDTLFEIDAAPQQALLAHAEAEYLRSEALLSQSKQQFARAQKLVADHVVSQQQYDDAETNVQIANATLASARAARDSARIDLGYTHITAPIAGRISKVMATPGNVVQASGIASGTLLTTLVATDPLYVAFDVDEATWQRIGANLRASAEGGAPVAVRVQLSGNTSSEHVGHVSFVDNHIDPASGSIRIRATVANPAGELTPGAFARVQIDVAPARSVLLINERTVLAQLATRYVYSVDANGITIMRPVVLGNAIGTMRIVEKGLSADDRIVVNNLNKIFFPGMPVTPVPASMETLDNLAPPASATPASSATPPAEVPAHHDTTNAAQDTKS